MSRQAAGRRHPASRPPVRQPVCTYVSYDEPAVQSQLATHEVTIATWREVTRIRSVRRDVEFAARYSLPSELVGEGLRHHDDAECLLVEEARQPLQDADAKAAAVHEAKVKYNAGPWIQQWAGNRRVLSYFGDVPKLA